MNNNSHIDDMFKMVLTVVCFSGKEENNVE